MPFAKINSAKNRMLRGFWTKFRPACGASGAGDVGGLHGKGEGLVGHEGGHVSNFQLFPALGHHQQHLDIAAALRGQGGGVREALGVLVVQRDGGGALDGLAVAGSHEVGGVGSQCVEVCVHIACRGHRVGGVDGVHILCADGEGLILGAVHHGDQNCQIFITLLLGSGVNAEQAGELNTQTVPVADLIADLDGNDGGAAVLLAAGQHAGCAQSHHRSTGTLQKSAAGNAVGHNKSSLKRAESQLSRIYYSVYTLSGTKVQAFWAKNHLFFTGISPFRRDALDVGLAGLDQI